MIEDVIDKLASPFDWQNIYWGKLIEAMDGAHRVGKLQDDGFVSVSVVIP